MHQAGLEDTAYPVQRLDDLLGLPGGDQVAFGVRDPVVGRVERDPERLAPVGPYVVEGPAPALRVVDLLAECEQVGERIHGRGAGTQLLEDVLAVEEGAAE